MLYFVFENDKKKAYITSEYKKGKEIGQINNVKLIYIYDKTILLNKNNKGKKPPVYLYALLKSNLQKQIRRGEKEAITTAEMMLDLNIFEFLRRLSVIALEDVEMTYETSIIVWLMSAVSKGFILSPSLKEFILNYVSSLIKYPICRRLIVEKKEWNENLKIEDVLKSNHPDKEYIAAILFRASFGGLHGDILLFSKLCDEIIKNNRRLTHIKFIPYEKTFLKIADSAVDFHIYPDLIKLIEKDTGIKPDLIKSTIWECSSSINFRFIKSDLNLDIWEKIKLSFDFHSKTYLSKIMKMY